MTITTKLICIPVNLPIFAQNCPTAQLPTLLPRAFRLSVNKLPLPGHDLQKALHEPKQRTHERARSSSSASALLKFPQQTHAQLIVFLSPGRFVYLSHVYREAPALRCAMTCSPGDPDRNSSVSRLPAISGQLFADFARPPVDRIPSASNRLHGWVQFRRELSGDRRCFCFELCGLPNLGVVRACVCFF